MSFDLFVVMPKISVNLARSCNRYAGIERPAELEFDLATCEDSSACWELRQNGETWPELYPNREEGGGCSYLPTELAGATCELHIPSDGHPSVFRPIRWERRVHRLFVVSEHRRQGLVLAGAS